MILLTVFHNDEPIKTYQVDRNVLNIGRLPENDIPIASISISRRHVRIERNAMGDYILTDLNSLNGTFVNNKKVKELKLTDGDKITIGKYSLIFEIGMESNEPTTVAPVLPLQEPVIVPAAEPVADAEKEQIIEEQGDSPGGMGVLIETNKHVVYKLDKPAMSIGSSEKDDIFVDGFLITDGHVMIERNDEGTWIHANKLMGKFRVNGKKVNLHKLQHKDRIEIGSSTFRFMENGQK
jgi:pSer/pThr/pTyr-binding forkhead associated (FHA) protein